MAIAWVGKGKHLDSGSSPKPSSLQLFKRDKSALMRVHLLVSDLLFVERLNDVRSRHLQQLGRGGEVFPGSIPNEHSSLPRQEATAKESSPERTPVNGRFLGGSRCPIGFSRLEIWDSSNHCPLRSQQSKGLLLRSKRDDIDDRPFHWIRRNFGGLSQSIEDFNPALIATERRQPFRSTQKQAWN